MAATIVCPACAKENAATFNFCLECGSDLKRLPTGAGIPVAPGARPPTAMPPMQRTPGPSAPARPAAVPLVAPIPSSPQPAPLPPRATPAPAPIPLTANSAVNAQVPPAPSVMMGAPIPLTRASAPGERRCSSCKNTVPPGFAFCGSCGTRMPAEDAAPEKGGTRFMHAVSVEEALKPKARLITIRSDGAEGASFQLNAGDNAAGRSQGNVLFPEDPYVSPRHCRFLPEGERLVVEDTGSRNGIYRRIRGEITLGHGSHLRVGRQLLRFEPMQGQAAADADGTRVWGSPDPGFVGRLVQILEGGGTGEAFPLRAGDNLIGRESGDLTFPGDGFVSGRHAAIHAAADGARVRDLGSSNGTFVRLTERTALDHGDFLLIGNQLLRVDLR